MRTIGGAKLGCNRAGINRSRAITSATPNHAARHFLLGERSPLLGLCILNRSEIQEWKDP